MSAIPRKWIFACVDCGCIFTTMAEKQTGACPVCKSSDKNKIEVSTIRQLKCLPYPDRSSAFRLAPHLRHEYVLTLSCVSETITVLGVNSVSQLGHLADIL